jgi:hypothetical protein
MSASPAPWPSTCLRTWPAPWLIACLRTLPALFSPSRISCRGLLSYVPFITPGRACCNCARRNLKRIAKQVYRAVPHVAEMKVPANDALSAPKDSTVVKLVGAAQRRKGSVAKREQGGNGGADKGTDHGYETNYWLKSFQCRLYLRPFLAESSQRTAA